MLQKPSIVFALATIFLAVNAYPQKEEEPRFSSESRLVVLHATVMDKNDNLITNLPQSAFQVYENGAEQQIKVFRREDIPVSLGLLIDNSGSMNNKRLKVESAALALVKASNPQDEVFVVNFNYEPYLDADFTSDIRQLEKAVSRLDSRGGTAMRDAVSMALRHLTNNAKQDKKVLLVVTDGTDNISKIDLAALVQEIQKTDVLIYTIGLLSEEEPKEAKQARRALGALSESSGGQAYYPKEVSEVEGIARRVAHDIRNQYTIAYSPTNQALDNTFRRIRVTVNAPNKPVVRTRTGYYATPEKPTEQPATGQTTSPSPASSPGDNGGLNSGR